MLCVLLHRAVALTLSLLYVSALARMLPKDPKLMPKGLTSRQVCVDDDILLSLKHWNYDAEEWCRTLLSIPDITVPVLTVTSRTTTTLISTTIATMGGVTTVPSSTSTIIISAFPFQKRMANPIPVTGKLLDVPIVGDVNDGTLDESLSPSVLRSACGCLFLQTRTIQVISTVTTTRSLRAVEYDTTVSYKTVTSGITTKYTTLAQLSSITSNIPAPVLPQVSAPTEPPSVNLSSSSIPKISTNQTFVSTISVSSIPSNILNNVSRPSTSLSPAASLPALGPCPVADNTIYTFADNASFLVECYTHREGDDVQGLDRPNFRACVQACTTANDGFSSIQCHAVSYFPKNNGVNCFFRTLGSLSVYNVSSQEVSARLLLDDTTNIIPKIPKASSPSGLVSVLPSLTSNFLNTSGSNTSLRLLNSLNTDISSPSASITLSLNATNTVPISITSTGASLSILSLPLNLTGIIRPTLSTFLKDNARSLQLSPSMTPTNSLNVTSLPSAGFPVPALNRTISFNSTAIELQSVINVCSNLCAFPTSTSVYNVTKTVVSTYVSTFVVTSNIVSPVTSLSGGIRKPI